jgi:4-phospho-D-threonate 3-dehydrogenase / 4-phospho-D-erythronate 3-dehydrogenase
MTKTTPLLGITMGDAGGVGPEIVLKAYRDCLLTHRFVVIGDMCILQRCKEVLSYSVDLRVVDRLEDAVPGSFNVYDMRLQVAQDLSIGKVSATAGRAALQYLTSAVRAALDHRISAIVTLPMNKEATRLSTPNFTGHTEVIAEMCGVRDYVMMLASDKLLVTHVSSHVSLKEAIQRVTGERVRTVIELTDAAARKMKRSRKIAVMGLNPHAGEGGAFGTEDRDVILPAVQNAAAKGIDVTGPLPPDTVFMRALRGEFGAVVCMYHDQGHIPMKAVGFENTVNITVGLPIVRTSVDHGTAFDIAYQGVASTGSFVQACTYASQLSS